MDMADLKQRDWGWHFKFESQMFFCFSFHGFHSLKTISDWERVEEKIMNTQSENISKYSHFHQTIFLSDNMLAEVVKLIFISARVRRFESDPSIGNYNYHRQIWEYQSLSLTIRHTSFKQFGSFSIPGRTKDLTLYFLRACWDSDK